MINYEPVIATALFEDETINQLTGGRVYAGDFPSEFSRQYPHILVAEGDNVDVVHADNKSIASEIDIQVNIWIKADDNIGPLQTAVDKKMKALNCKRVAVTPFNESERDAFRKAFLYRTRVKLEEENK
ncbi:hypothetical protein TNQ50_17125 [Bacillus subtilis]|uniref:hypothetical protein n=1 Tax=Bacillus subtilis TaxID=1423 RepID=UPI001B9D6E3B|nr:hypothetical protein [Bacillus subtilis]MEA3602367.1 hypothetical protein [Bacillus subtilis]CAF1851911.1 hypothetical protein NRS6181_00813 [Bacillus subtilis]CAI6308796.1 DUF3168 domain-containing protein [Bacillus subtilis]